MKILEIEELLAPNDFKIPIILVLSRMRMIKAVTIFRMATITINGYVITASIDGFTIYVADATERFNYRELSEVNAPKPLKCFEHEFDIYRLSAFNKTALRTAPSEFDESKEIALRDTIVGCLIPLARRLSLTS